jgi:protein phosphatase
MADYVLRVGSHSAQGTRPKNEDRYVVDTVNRVYLVADGMGGQERGELASGMAADIIPRSVQNHLAAKMEATQAVKQALKDANLAIVEAGRTQAPERRMGTTAVMALQQEDRFFVAGLGDSRAYLIRGDHVEQLTVDHSVAQSLVSNGVLSQEEAQHSPWQHVLHKFLGCADMPEGAEVRPLTPEAGDRMLLASDGLTNHVTEKDLIEGPRLYPDPQRWAEFLVSLALKRGSRDNVTCVVLAFDPE